VLATIDSEAMRSLINETLLRKLKASVTVREVCTGMGLADGTSVSITGMVVTNVCLFIYLFTYRQWINPYLHIIILNLLLKIN